MDKLNPTCQPGLDSAYGYGLTVPITCTPTNRQPATLVWLDLRNFMNSLPKSYTRVLKEKKDKSGFSQ